jgi:hypothetical protein
MRQRVCLLWRKGPLSTSSQMEFCFLANAPKFARNEFPVEDSGIKNRLSNVKLLLTRRVLACTWAKPAQSWVNSPYPLIFLMGLIYLLTWIGPDQKFTIFSTG